MGSGFWWCMPWSESQNPRTRSASVWVQKKVMSRLKQRNYTCSSSAILFCLLPQQIEWCHLHCWRQSSLVRLLTQRLISSGNIFTDRPRNNVLPVISASLSPVKLTHKIDHHTVILMLLICELHLLIFLFKPTWHSENKLTLVMIQCLF
jgi:hypothetical protein